MLAKAPTHDKAAILCRAWQVFHQANADWARFHRILAGNPRCGRSGGEVIAPAIRSFSDALKFAWFESKQPKIHDLMAALAADYLARNAA